jgi:hypothetical protein
MNKFKNLEKVIRALEELGVSVSPSETKAILHSALEPTVFQIKAGLMKNGVPETAYDFVTKNDGKFINKKKVTVIAAIDYQDPKAYLVNWMEYGTAPRYKDDGSYTGQIVARPVIRPAIDANLVSMRDRVMEAIEDLILLEGKKNGFA